MLDLLFIHILGTFLLPIKFLVSMPTPRKKKRSSTKYLLFAPVEKLHRSDEKNSQASKEDKNLVTILILRGVVCREQYHCDELAELVQNIRGR